MSALTFTDRPASCPVCWAAFEEYRHDLQCDCRVACYRCLMQLRQKDGSWVQWQQCPQSFSAAVAAQAELAQARATLDEQKQRKERWRMAYDDLHERVRDIAGYGEDVGTIEALERLKTERDEARATLEQVAALLPKWGGRADTTKWLLGIEQPWTVCWNDLSRALRPPETAAEYEAHLAEHRDEERLQRMEEADREGETG